MALGARTRRGLMWIAWTILCLCVAMLIGLKVGRPLYYSDGSAQVAGSELAGAGMLRWPTPEAELEVPGRLTGRVARLPDGRLLYGVLGDDGTSDLVTWDPSLPDVPPEPAYGLNTDDNELAPAVGPDGAIYFASDRDESVGGYDLFVARSQGRGFGAAVPLDACNTLWDETDPAPDPVDRTLVFARVDRDGAGAGADSGSLWRWQLGDVFDPDPVFDEAPRRRSGHVDRDPVFAPDGASLWFVRREAGQPVAIARSSRLGEAFDEPVLVSQDWGTERLRSPVPLPGGRQVAFVQPARLVAVADGAPAPTSLWFVSTAEELVPWWPGQHWLEWLLLSFALCALLLLLLLYFGQRWSTLDLVAQCLLLSLLLHVLLFLWLMGVEIAGSLLPGGDEDDSGMQVSIVASTGSATRQSMSSAGGGDVAARVQRDVAERSFDVVRPGTSTEPSTLDRATSLAVDNGAYERTPEAAAAHAAQDARLEDAAAAFEPEAGEDAAAELRSAQLAQVQPVALRADEGTARVPEAGSDEAARIVTVATPSSGVLQRRTAAAELAGAGDLQRALPVRGAPAQPTGEPGAMALQDRAAAAVAANAGSDAASEPIARAEPDQPEGGAARAVPAPARGESANPPSTPDVVARPGTGVGRAARSEPLAAGDASRPDVAGPVARRDVTPSVALRGDVPTAAGADAVARSEGPAPEASVERVAEGSRAPAAPRGMELDASRSAAEGSRATVRAALPVPGSSLDRMRARIDAGAAPSRGAATAPTPTRDIARPMAALRGPDGASPRAANPAAADAGRRAVDARRPERGLPGEPLAAVRFAPRRGPEHQSALPGAFAERFAVEPPATRVARAAMRQRTLPQPSQPALARSAYSNRFGPAKAEALERFGGTDETERAVRDGLRYLASIQHQGGWWGDRRDYDGKYGFVYVGKTALCVLAFLGAGHSPTSNTEYSDHVRRAVEHLLSLQEERTGAFGRSSCYGHGIATYAIAECYGMTKDEALVRPLEDALAWILANQGPRRDARNRGGWGYFSPGLRAEDSFARMSVSAWMIMALESARMSGIVLPDDALPAARQYLELSFDRENGWFRYNHNPQRLRSGWPTLPASTPAGAFCLMLLGVDAADERVAVATEYTVERRPRDYRRYGDDAFVLRGQGNVYFWYYGSLCCFLKGGEAWQQWNERLSTVLPQAQSDDGSFRPIDVYAEEAGDDDRDRSYTTAMCVLSLEVYYRYFTPLLVGR